LPGHHAPRATKVPANQSPRVFRRHKPAQGIGCSAFEHSEHGRRHPELRACVPGAKPNGSDHEAAQRAVGAFFLGNLGEGADREELAPGALLRAIERGGPRADTSAPRQRWRSRGMSSVAARAALYALILCSGVVRWRCVDIKQGSYSNSKLPKPHNPYVQAALVVWGSCPVPEKAGSSLCCLGFKGPSLFFLAISLGPLIRSSSLAMCDMQHGAPREEPRAITQFTWHYSNEPCFLPRNL